MLANTSAAKNVINMMGQSAVLTHYTGTTTYDADTEVPTHENGTSSILAMISEPTKQDVENGAGKVTLGTKRFSLNKDVIVSNGDRITINSKNYEIVLSNDYANRSVVFANLLPTGT